MRRFPSLGLNRLSGVYLFALFILIFGIWTPNTFLTVATLHSVASTQAVGGMVAIAILIPLVCGQYDLSVGATANFSGIFAMEVQLNWHWGVAPSIVIAVVAGLVIGAINGFIVVKLKVNSFIATLGMSSVIEAFQVIVTKNNQPNPILTPGWNEFTQRTIGGFQIVVLYLLILSVVAWWLLQHTPAGRYLYATGGNQEAARLSGVRVNRWSVTSLIISGGVSGLAGVFYTSLSGPSLSFGATLLLPAFAAAFLGSTQLFPGRFNVWGTVIAIYVLATGVEGLQLVTSAQWLPDMFDGVALIAAVAVAVVRRPTSGRRMWGRRRGIETARDNEVPVLEDTAMAAARGGAPADGDGGTL